MTGLHESCWTTPCLNSTMRRHAHPRHGLRIGELVALRWDKMDFTVRLFHVARSRSSRAESPEARAAQRMRRAGKPALEVPGNLLERRQGANASPVTGTIWLEPSNLGRATLPAGGVFRFCRPVVVPEPCC